MQFPFYIKLAAYLICIVLGTIILVYAKDFLAPIVLSTLVSFLLYPFCKKLELKKIPALLAIIISMLLVLFIFLLMLFFISSQISSMVANMSDSNQTLVIKINNLHYFITNRLHISNATLNEWIEHGKSNLIKNSGAFISETFAATSEIVTYFSLVPVYVFCFLLFRKSLKDFVFTLINKERQSEMTLLLKNIQKLSQNYLIGLISVILIVGILNSIGLWAIGIDFALFFGFIAALLTVIPYIGIFIGSLLPIAFVLLTMSSYWPAIGVIVIYTLVQFLESNYITPRIVGSKVSINPFVAIVALLLGATIWGATGMILSIPITAILKVIFDSQESTKAIGYFLGSELTNKKVPRA